MQAFFLLSQTTLIHADAMQKFFLQLKISDLVITAPSAYIFT